MFSIIPIFLLLAKTTISLPIDYYSTLTNTSLSNTISAITTSPTSFQTVDSKLYAFNSTSLGSCNFTILNDDDTVAALPLNFFNTTGNIVNYCGLYIIVNSNITQQTLTVRIVDVASTSAIELSPAVFSLLNGTPYGLGLVNWRFASLRESEEALDASITAGELAAMMEFASALTGSKLVSAYSTASPFIATTDSAAYTPVYTPAYTPAYTPSPTPTPLYVSPVATVQPVASVASSDTDSSTPSTSSSSSSLTDTYAGGATYFYQNGVAGACGTVHSDSTYLVAIDIDMWANGSNCGRTVKITNTATGASVNAFVADQCPTCDSSQSLDLSVGAFQAIGSESQGLIPMTWSFTS